ncbi:hypothetical protein KCU85_g322, partial [Aureobasidium melanogenum]
MIPPKGMRHADHALTATQWPIFTSYSAGAEPFFPRIMGSKGTTFIPFFFPSSWIVQVFIMEVLCTQMCATASLCVDPPGRQFLFYVGLWVKGRELLRMELQRRKSARSFRRLQGMHGVRFIYSCILCSEGYHQDILRSNGQGLWVRGGQKWLFHMLLAQMWDRAGLKSRCSVLSYPSWASKEVLIGGIGPVALTEQWLCDHKKCAQKALFERDSRRS